MRSPRLGLILKITNICRIPERIGSRLSGVVLLFGAFAKFYSAWADVAPILLFYSWRGGIAAIAAIEFTLGLALLTQTYSRLARGSTISLLLLFSAFHVLVMLEFIPACGCLGSHSLPSPIMLGVCLGLAGLLLLEKPSATTSTPLNEVVRVSFYSAIGASIAIIVTLFAHGTQLDPHGRSNGLSTGPDTTISSDSSIRMVLSSLNGTDIGEWGIVLYRPGCMRCMDEMPDIIWTVALEVEQNKRRWYFVNIEAPGLNFDDIEELRPAGTNHAKIPSNAVASPLIIYLNDNKVQSVRNQIRPD